MDDADEAHKGGAPFKRLLAVVFQGYAPWPYLKASAKLLVAGFLGVVTGWVLQPFFTTVFGLPYWLSYWPAVLAGFIVNLRAQVKMRNLKLPEKEPRAVS